MTPMLFPRWRAMTAEVSVSSRRERGPTLPSATDRLGGRTLIGFVFVWAVAGSSACDSNPTPHPASDASVNQDTSRGDSDPNITAPTDQAGCDAVGGFWTGDDCQTESDAPDTDAATDLTDAGDVDGTDGDAGPEDGDSAEADGSHSDADDRDYRHDGSGGAGGQMPR